METMSLETGCVSPAVPSHAPVSPYYIAIDLETTGLFAHEHGICQIGAVAANESGEIVSTYVDDVLPPSSVRIEASALEINGFDHARLLNGTPERTALQNFLAWKDSFSGQTPVAIFHNSPFDVGFLKVAFRRNALDEGRFLRRVRDTATMSPDVFGEDDYPRSLEEICNKLGIEKVKNHDALHDALATLKAFFALKRILDDRMGRHYNGPVGFSIGGFGW